MTTRLSGRLMLIAGMVVRLDMRANSQPLRNGSCPVILNRCLRDSTQQVSPL
jgi:hypothetical protein